MDAPVAPRAPSPVGIEALCRQHRAYVHRLTRRLMGPGEEVEDVVQDVFLAAIRGVGQLRHPEAVRSWLTQIVVRSVSAWIRRRQRLPALVPALEEEMVAAPASDPWQWVVASTLWAAIDRLPSPVGQAWRLQALEQQPLEEIARLCGCSVATAKRRIARAQQRLRRVALA
jgi:RNA polymerase sigma-70 factor (ECF subfamily)